MTNTTKNEAPLTWSSKPEWGCVGNTHRTSITLDNGDRWSFVVDQPRKGYWVARGWRADRDTTGSGDMVLYREAKTLKDAKAQVQAHANLAQTSTCDQCRKIAAHRPDCSAVARIVNPSLVRFSGAAGAIRAASDTFQQVGVTAALASRVLKSMARGIQDVVWNNVHRPAGCTCPTPTHRMSCGHGARPVVISKAGA